MKKFTWMLCALMLCSVIATGCSGGDGKDKKENKKPPAKKPGK